MPVDASKFSEIKSKLAGYVKGWTAYGLLKESLADRNSVTTQEFEGIIGDLKVKKPEGITVFDAISEIIKTANNREGGPIQWTKEGDEEYKKLVVALGTNVFEVKITKEPPEGSESYTIDITGVIGPEANVDANRLDKFHPPGIDAGKTRIKFDGDRYTIASDDGKPLLNETARAPRPLQLNAVRAYAIAVEGGGSSSQLALLGTGTGKSFVIASLAEAIGSSVIILPTGELGAQMLNDAIKKKIFLGEMVTKPKMFEVNGESVPISVARRPPPKPMAGEEPKIIEDVPPYAVLSKDIANIEIFKALLARPDVHIILGADDPSFKTYLPLIENKLLLIDETHQHAYTHEAAEELKEVCERNATYALTGTPTSPLYHIFNDTACVEFNLGNAIDAHLLRGVAGEDIRLDYEEAQLVKKTIVTFFKPVFLQDGDPGYKKPSEPADIASVLRNMPPPCQKGMIFSDDPKILSQIHQELADIENGTLSQDWLEYYQKQIRDVRIEELKTQLKTVGLDATETELKAAIPEVNLKDEMLNARKEAMQNTVYSSVLSVLFKGEDREKFSSLLRSDTLDKLSWKGSRYRLDEKPTPPTVEKAISEGLAKIEDFKTLPEEYKVALKAMATEVALELNERIKTPPHPDNLSVVSAYLKSPECSKIVESGIKKLLDEHPCSAVAVVGLDTSPDVAVQTLASLTCGVSLVAISDERWATGVSVPDVLTTIIVNGRLNFEAPNAVCAPLGAAQAVGRAVRNTDLRASATIITHQDFPEELVFKVEAILALDSGEQSKPILVAWDKARTEYNRVFKEELSKHLTAGKPPDEAEGLARNDAYKKACEIVSTSVETLIRSASEAAEPSETLDVIPTAAEAVAQEEVPEVAPVVAQEEVPEVAPTVEQKQVPETTPAMTTRGVSTTLEYKEAVKSNKRSLEQSNEEHNEEHNERGNPKQQRT